MAKAKTTEVIEGMYRQGDVLVMPAQGEDAQGAEIPLGAGRVVLAYGEVTGHAHAIVADGAKQFRAKGTQLKSFLHIIAPVVLRHEEHAPIKIEGKVKEVRIQRQWSSERIRQVAD